MTKENQGGEANPAARIVSETVDQTRMRAMAAGHVVGVNTTTKLLSATDLWRELTCSLCLVF